MWNLGEEMMNDMCSNVMMDVVYPTIITVNCCKPSSEVTPFLISTSNSSFSCYSAKKGTQEQDIVSSYLPAVPRKLVIMAMMVQVRDQIQPHNKNLK